MARKLVARYGLRFSESGSGARGAVEDSTPTCTSPPNPTPEAILEVAQNADAILTTYAKVTADMIPQLTRCRIIGRFGIGVDNVDIPAATAKGIVVTRVPDYCLDEVSDHAMALLLARRSQNSLLERTHALRHLGNESRRADSSPSRNRAGSGGVRADSSAGRARRRNRLGCAL